MGRQWCHHHLARLGEHLARKRSTAGWQTGPEGREARGPSLRQAPHSPRTLRSSPLPDQDSLPVAAGETKAQSG